MATSILMQRSLLKAACLSNPDLKAWITWLELSLPRLPVMITTPNTPWQTVSIDFHSAPVHLSLIPMKGAQPQKACHAQSALHIYTVCIHRIANLNPSHLSQTQMFYSALQTTWLEVSYTKSASHHAPTCAHSITHHIQSWTPALYERPWGGCLGESATYLPLSGWRSISWSPA